MDYLHEVLPNQIETTWSRHDQPQVHHAMECYAATQCFSQHGWHCGYSGYAKPGRRVSSLKCTASHCQRTTQTLLISHLLTNELNNIKAGCYIGEVLLNHLMFADDICVFCPNVRWLQRILDVCQAYAASHGIIFNCNKTVCMTFKAKSAKSTAPPVLKLGGQYVNSVDQYKALR